MYVCMWEMWNTYKCTGGPCTCLCVNVCCRAVSGRTRVCTGCVCMPLHACMWRPGFQWLPLSGSTLYYFKKKALKLISLWGHMCHGACTSEDNLKGLVLFPLYGTQVAGIRLPLVLVSHWTRSSPFWVRLAYWWAHEIHLTPLLNARIQAQTPMSSFWGRCWGFKLRTSHTEFTCS